MGHAVRGHLHAQVAARHHHAVGRLHDSLDVLDRLGRLDLRDKADMPAAVRAQKRPYLAHGLGAAHEGGGHEVHVLLDAEEDVRTVLVGHDGQRHRHAGHVDGLALAEHGVVDHAAGDVRSFDGLHR